LNVYLPDLISNFDIDFEDTVFEKVDRPIPLKYFPPCINKILKSKEIKAGRTRAITLLATFLGQCGWGGEKASKLFREKAEELSASTTNIFDSWFRRMRTPSCRTIQSSGGGFPNMNMGEIDICCPDKFCAGIKNPYMYAKTKFNSEHINLEDTFEFKQYGNVSYQYANTVDGIVKIKIEDGKIASREKIVNAPLTLKNVLLVDDQTVFEIECSGAFFKGTLSDFIGYIQSKGMSIKKNELQDAVSAIISSQKKKFTPYKTHAGCGIYYEKGKFMVCIQAAAPITTSQKVQYKSVSKAWERDLEDFEVKDILNNYLWLIDQFHPYEILPNMGFGSIGPLLYELKGTKRLDYTPYPFNVGSHGLGKSTTVKAVTTRLWGVKGVAGKSIDSAFRLEECIDSTTFPLRVGEVEKVKFNDFIAILKSASEEQDLSSRGRPNLTKQLFFARAPLIFDSNSLCISEQNFLPRMIVIIFDSAMKEKRAQRRIKFKETYNKIQPIGKYLLKVVIEELQKDNSDPLEKLTNLILDIEKKINSYGIPFEDSRRALMWAEVYMGLEFWKWAFVKYGLNWSYNLDNFVEQVIKPIEKTSADDYTETSPLQFRAWFQYYLSMDATRHIKDSVIMLGEDEIWKKSDDGYWITRSILGRYNKDAFRNETLSTFKSLAHLAREIGTLYRMKFDDLYKNQWFGKKQFKAVFIPTRETPQIEGFGDENDK
ncbi:MAG: hypothetical protein KAJ51_08890, partial [Thermoplasmata archaeon]|nr:hypothetical protein [Thermoplasmata archaeon]